MASSYFENTQFYIARNKGNTQIGSASSEEPIKLYLTATTNTSFNQAATVTTNPVSDGSNISDHTIIQNATITVSGVLAETTQILSWREGANRQDYLKDLFEIRDNKELVEVFFSEIIEGSKSAIKGDWVITDVTLDKTRKVGTGLAVNLALKKVLKGVSTTTTPIVSLEQKDIAAPENNTGASSGEVKEPTTIDAISSVTQQVIEKLGL